MSYHQFFYFKAMQPFNINKKSNGEKVESLKLI